MLNTISFVYAYIYTYSYPILRDDAYLLTIFHIITPPHIWCTHLKLLTQISSSPKISPSPPSIILASNTKWGNPPREGSPKCHNLAVEWICAPYSWIICTRWSKNNGYMNLLQCRTPAFWRALLQRGISKIKSSHDSYRNVFDFCVAQISTCVCTCVYIYHTRGIAKGSYTNQPRWTHIIYRICGWIYTRHVLYLCVFIMNTYLISYLWHHQRRQYEPTSFR